jgi:hypothetical protein
MAQELKSFRELAVVTGVASPKVKRKFWKCADGHLFAFTPGCELPVCTDCGKPLFQVEGAALNGAVKELLFPTKWKRLPMREAA